MCSKVSRPFYSSNPCSNGWCIFPMEFFCRTSAQHSLRTIVGMVVEHIFLPQAHTRASDSILGNRVKTRSMDTAFSSTRAGASMQTNRQTIECAVLVPCSMTSRTARVKPGCFPTATRASGDVRAGMVSGPKRPRAHFTTALSLAGAMAPSRGQRSELDAKRRGSGYGDCHCVCDLK